MIHGVVRRGILAPFLTRGIKNKKVFLPPLRQFKQVNTDTFLPSSLFQQKVVLVVNTASKCGFTPQLKSLQELHSKYASRGLTVLAVPSNDFGSQEPDNEETVEAFYKKEYNVEFPITKKYHVIGPDAHPFFNAIVDQYTEDVAPSWNFEKFFVDNTGDLRAVFPRDVDPLEPEVIETIENLLEELPKEQKQ
ncbi:unnamed protein product [Aphanomyces euteiches]|uniref:Glutathione peroxidase n=1 Tax=Aphanomyces euteiches TaxID=100861 RepID=A0A6G0WW64_9STRA|nr:hypothetical protein Ae201684_011024 [Aphanomyces euteiches]KAH9058421.1 hypothetical protein Ae201684P_005764 [Aphanomyces euteiches]KAH9145696.1 hypothetical protein AeRB84_010407 [Aphanomyces euteiches]